MFCRNCGQKLADGDKFCSSCGTKTEAVDTAAPEGFTAPVEESSPAAKAEDKPLFEPFDFKAFGFDFADLGLGLGAKKEEPVAEESKPTTLTEEFDWNTGAFPTSNAAKKTEDVNFNWSLSSDTPEPAAEPEVFTADEPVWTEAKQEPSQTAELEAELFGDIESKADETRKQSEEIDKFFTFHKKNEEFQKILDREYEKVKTGNIITEEMNAADTASEEKFTARQPEDPMEELFAEAGVIKGYEPKPVESDVLDRIEAADAEKRIREEAARIADEKRTAMEAETAAPAEDAADAPAAVTEETVEDVAVEEVQAEEPAVEEIEAVPAEEEYDAPEKTKQVDKATILAEIALASEMVERDRAMAAAQGAAAVAAAETVAEEAKVELPDFLGHQEETEEAAVEEITLDMPAEEPAAEAAAVEEVAAEETVEEVAVEEIAVEEIAEIVEETEETPAEETVQEEIPEDAAAEPEAEVEFDIFEELEKVEAPAEEIVLTAPQTIEELFAEIPTVETEEEETVTAHTVVLTEDSVAEILKTVEEDTTKDDTMVFTAHALGALLAEAEQNDPDASEVVVSLEELTALEQQAAEGTLPPVGVDAEAAEDEEEEIQGGKGRTFLKVCLVILVILLVIEVAGVAIKIAAPTSGAANFIDNQLNKVFQLIGEEDTAPEDYNA